MKQFTLKLDKNRQRPVVLLSNGLTALLDTEAYNNIAFYVMGEVF